MTSEELKFNCLTLACKDAVTHDAIKLAKVFYDFIKDTNDQEIVEAARVLAAKVKN